MRENCFMRRNSCAYGVSRMFSSQHAARVSISAIPDVGRALGHQFRNSAPRRHFYVTPKPVPAASTSAAKDRFSREKGKLRREHEICERRDHVPRAHIFSLLFHTQICRPFSLQCSGISISRNEVSGERPLFIENHHDRVT